MSLGGMTQYCLLQEWFSCAPPYPRVPDGQHAREGGSHQRAVQDDLGQTSYVLGQECVDLVLTFDLFSSISLSLSKDSKYNHIPLFSLYHYCTQ